MNFRVYLFISALFTVLLFSNLAFGQSVENGEKLFQGKCIKCHGEDARGVEAEQGPRLRGQFDWYIVSSLEKFKSGERKNEVMMPYLKGLSDSDYKDIAAYLSNLTE